MTTLKDIAKQAGVSKSTVSRYLNNGQVSEKTRKKISKIIEETNYQPNTFARSLKSSQTKLIGVVVPRFDSGATTSVLTSIDEIAYQHGYQLLIINSALDSEREKSNLKTLASQKVDGIIFLATRITKELENIIDKLEVPCVLVGQTSERIFYIAHDDYQAGKKMAQHVNQLGHQQVLFIGVDESDHAVGVMRKKGFLEGCKNVGIECQVRITSFSKSENYTIAKDYLKDTKATYIACATDHMAVSVVKAAQELGLNIPKDISISGFGGYSEFDYFTPSLTTVKYPFKESGQRAFESMLDLINNKTIYVNELLENKLLIKESTQKHII